VHGDQLCRFAEELLVDFLEFAHDVAVGLRFPAGVFAGVFHFKARHFAHGSHHAGGSQHAALDGAALAGHNLDCIAFGGDHGKIGGGLDQLGNVGAHRENAVMQAREQRHGLFRVIRVENSGWAFGLLNCDLQSGIEASQVRFVSSFGGGDLRFQVAFARGVQQYHGCSFARNGILRASAIDFGDFDRKAIQQDLKNPTQDSQGIAAALMDIDPEWPPFRPDTLMRQADPAPAG